MLTDNPHHRFRKYLEARGWWSAEDEETVKAAHKKAIMSAFQSAEKLKKPQLDNLFNDVYDELPWNLVSRVLPKMALTMLTRRWLQIEQRDELKRLLGKYGEAWEPWRNERSKFKSGGAL